MNFRRQPLHQPLLILNFIPSSFTFRYLLSLLFFLVTIPYSPLQHLRTSQEHAIPADRSYNFCHRDRFLGYIIYYIVTSSTSAFSDVRITRYKIRKSSTYSSILFSF
jgi:hypothetical protein